MSRQKQSDFRYATGDAAVPWHAVGENVNIDDIVELVSTLIPSDSEKDGGYPEKLDGVRSALEGLLSAGKFAGKLSLDEKVKQAEEKTREFLGVKHACMLASWTGGMEIAQRLAGLTPDDEVIVPTNTFIATMIWPLSIGAKVVFADVDPRTVNMLPEDLERKITPKTRVIIPVHVGGYPADMDPIMDLARKHDICVIEDAAHSFGATYKGRQAGTIGDFGGYSFHEVKNITSLGEGGMLVTNSELGEQLAKARFLGLDFSRKVENWLYDVTALTASNGKKVAPCNYSVTEAQAAVLISQMARVGLIIEQRRKAFNYLRERFAQEDAIILPMPDTEDIKSSHHLFLLRINPDALNGDIQDVKAGLSKRGVTEVQHFAPMYKFEIVRELGYDQKAIAETCPNTEMVFNHCYTHLPLYGLGQQQLETMADIVLDTVSELKKN